MSDHLKNWIPVSLFYEGGAWVSRWRFAGDIRFTDSFFSESLSRMQSDFRFRSNTVPELWGEVSSEKDPVPLRAVIFHVSRCGSTLLTQMLAKSHENIVLSEPPLLDEILRSCYHEADPGEAKRIQWLSQAIKLVAAKRFPEESATIIKADSWHLAFANQFQVAWPDVPRIFLYRDPAEVMRSQMKSAGMHAVPGLLEPQIFGIEREEIDYSDRTSWLVRVLEFLYSKILEEVQKPGKVLMLNYNQGPIEIIQFVLNYLEMNVPSAVWDEMVARTAFHSKRNNDTFSGDEPGTDPPQEKMIRLNSIYLQLEKERLSRQ